jgi:hypothetical protein
LAFAVERGNSVCGGDRHEVDNSGESKKRDEQRAQEIIVAEAPAVDPRQLDVNDSDAKIATILAWSRTNHLPEDPRKVRVTRKSASKSNINQALRSILQQSLSLLYSNAQQVLMRS